MTSLRHQLAGSLFDKRGECILRLARANVTPRENTRLMFIRDRVREDSGKLPSWRFPEFEYTLRSWFEECKRNVIVTLHF